LNCPRGCNEEMVVVVDESFGKTYSCPKCGEIIDVEFTKIEVSDNGIDS